MKPVIIFVAAAAASDGAFNDVGPACSAKTAGTPDKMADEETKLPKVPTTSIQRSAREFSTAVEEEPEPYVPYLGFI